jgi:predicted ArsR family transcriptional regulator
MPMADESAQSSIDSSWFSVLTDPIRVTVLHSLCELGTATMAELSAHGHMSERTLRRHLDALAALELVVEQRGERDGARTGRPASRFALRPRARRQAGALFEVLSEPLRP